MRAVHTTSDLVSRFASRLFVRPGIIEKYIPTAAVIAANAGGSRSFLRNLAREK
jgi:hypothetical protein